MPPNDEGVAQMLSLIGELEEHSFTIFMNDHPSSATAFDTQFKFLHEKYSPRCAFGPVYSSGHKMSMFADSLKALGSEGNSAGLRLCIKHKDNEIEPGFQEIGIRIGIMVDSTKRID